MYRARIALLTPKTKTGRIISESSRKNITKTKTIRIISEKNISSIEAPSTYHLRWCIEVVPEVASPDMTSPEVASPNMTSPEFTSPEVGNRK